jgi:hypothetical protein
MSKRGFVRVLGLPVVAMLLVPCLTTGAVAQSATIRSGGLAWYFNS